MNSKESKIRTHLRSLGLSGRDLNEATECAMQYSLSQVHDWTSVEVEINDNDANTPVRVTMTDANGETSTDRFERNCGWVS